MTTADGDIPDSFRVLADALMHTQRQCIAQYTELVDALINDNCRDQKCIEQALDGLLCFADHPKGVLLYRRLCRHLWELDQEAAAWYVHYYRETWDPDDVRPWRDATHHPKTGHCDGETP